MKLLDFSNQNFFQVSKESETVEVVSDTRRALEQLFLNSATTHKRNITNTCEKQHLMYNTRCMTFSCGTWPLLD